MIETDQSERSVFLQAIEIVSAEERADYVQEACGANDRLRAEVEGLLRAHEKRLGLLDNPGFSSATIEQPIQEGPGTVIGPYKLLQQIGEGGMGVVFMAEQTHPLQRTVALKIIKPGMDTRQVIARFEAERQAVAMMDHPNIAKVLEAGTTDTGRPYFVMELVKGVPITKYCDEKQLPLPARLELFMQVCQAVQHAHQKGVIHRDIKPNNVLVAEYDNHAIPKVIDFGVAKATAQRLTERTMFTEFGQVLGTMEYMSPEQSKFNQLDIDTRSDIYSLGVLLYELLAGSTPFEGKRLHAAAFDEMLRIIREEEPPKPSTRVSSSDTLPSIAANRHTEPARLSKDVRGELDWIVMKALEKDRNRRYETASGFAADIERHLRDEPVEAGPPSAAYRFRKFAQRNKGPVAAIAAIVLSLTLGLVLTAIGFMQASRQRAIALSNEVNARTEAAKATAISGLLQEMLSSADPQQAKGAEYTVRQLLDDSSVRLRDQLQGQPDVEAVIRTAIGSAYRRLSMTDKAEPHLQRALAIRRMLVANAANNDDAQEALAQSLLEYGWNFYMSNRPVDTEHHVREAVAIYRDRGVRDARIIDALATLQLALNAQNRHEESIAVANEALALGRQLFPDGHPELADILHRLADAKRFQKDLPAAEALARQAVSMHQRWHGKTNIETGWSSYILGDIQGDRGELAESEANLRQALSIFRSQYGDSHDSVQSVLKRLQQILAARGDQAGLAALRADRGARLAKALKRDGTNIKLRIQLANSLAESGDLDGALAGFSEAAELASATTPDMKLRLAEGCSQLARLLRDKGRFEQAERTYRQAIALREPLVDKAPPQLRLAQANDYNDLAFVLKPDSRSPESVRALRAGLALKQALVREFPDNLDYRIHVAHSHLGLGHIAVDSGRTPDAVQAFGEAAAILSALATVASAHQGSNEFLGQTLDTLGNAWLRVNRPEDAAQAHQHALAVAPKGGGSTEPGVSPKKVNIVP
ncbi:MAG: protein kinase [Pirellulales bacterium]